MKLLYYLPMNTFLSIQLNRACYVSLLNLENMTNGITQYKKYINKLNLLMFNPFLTIKCFKEKSKAKEVFTEKAKPIAKKLIEDKKYTEALEIYKTIFEANSKDAENIKNYIDCLEKTEQFDLQFELAKHLISFNKEAESYKIISNAYGKCNKYKEAIKYYYDYIKYANKIKLEASDYNLIGCHYFNSYIKCGEDPDDANKALVFFKKTIEKSPKTKAYLKNAIVAAMKAKNFKEEKKFWEIYFKEGFANHEDEFTYSASCMRNGDIKTWAKYYDSRFKKNSPAAYPNLEAPTYTGKEDLSDKVLLIHTEQGFGDNFLMWGYMPRVAKLAKKVIYYIQNGIYDLVKDNPYGIEVYCQKIIEAKKLKFDYQLPCMSIPIVLDLDKDTLGVKGGYIKPDKKLTEEYKRKYFDNNKFKIAFAYKGVKSNAKRDIPLKTLALLDKLKDVQLYCFTKDIDDREFKVFKKNKIINIAKNFENFAHTAAALQNVDLVISSDNCILNLAGAIGKKTLGIFHYHHEFRWYDLSGDDCGWFDCVKPFVNDEYNNWDKSMYKIIDEAEIIQKTGV